MRILGLYLCAPFGSARSPAPFSLLLAYNVVILAEFYLIPFNAAPYESEIMV